MESKWEECWSDVEEIRSKLSSSLQGKRILLIVDDVWEADHARQLKVTRSNVMSRMLVTTRNKDIVRPIDHNAEVYPVGFLDQEQSWELFCRWAFKSPEIPRNKRAYTDLAEKMSMHCKGLPLALRVMGSMAAGFSTMPQWQDCVKKLQNTMSHLGGDYNKDLLPVLRLSYERLDDEQKSFFFCAVGYPEDCSMRVSDLVVQWTGLQPQNRRDWDSGDWWVGGHAVFGELLSRSLILMDDSYLNCESMWNQFCHLHDSVREMGLRTAEEQNENVTEQERLLFPELKELEGQSIKARELWTSAASWPEDLQAGGLVSYISQESGLTCLPKSLLLSKRLRILDLSKSALAGFPGGVEQLDTL